MTVSSAINAAAAPIAQPATGSALSGLTSNFTGFLKMLMTQLKNQDPTSPMDTNQFTSELVQFSSVEQQIATNTSLTKLIELTQAGEIMQASAMIGKRVTVESDHLPVQDGKGTLQFTASESQPVQIAVFSESGAKIRDETVAGAKGSNTWTWDGRSGAGVRVPDGAYKVAVTGAGQNGTSTALPFTVSGTATGVAHENNAVHLQLGTLGVAFGAVRSVAE